MVPHKNLISVADRVSSEPAAYEILLSPRGEFLSKSYVIDTKFIAKAAISWIRERPNREAYEGDRRNNVMSDYDAGRKARREGQPYEGNPYWGWFKRCAWERGWVDEEKAVRSAQNFKRPVRTVYPIVGRADDGNAFSALLYRLGS